MDNKRFSGADSSFQNNTKKSQLIIVTEVRLKVACISCSSFEYNYQLLTHLCCGNMSSSGCTNA